MNIKTIDAAISRYQDALDEGDRRRLAFFRELWGVLDEHAGKLPAFSYAMPSESELEKAVADGRPVFDVDPVAVDEAALVATLSDLAEKAVASGFFPEEVGEAFDRVKWDRVLAASDTASAGACPSAWLENFGQVLVDDGMSEDHARLGALLASLALKIQLEQPAAQVMRSVKKIEGVDRPQLCPVCGSAPALAHVGGDTSSAGRGRLLVCPQCASAWEYERVRCARCGTRNQAHLHFFNVEGDDSHRIATCDECGGYIRTLYSEDALAPCSYEVEDVVMARLDAIAQNPGLAKGREED